MKRKKQRGHRPPQPARQMPHALTQNSAVLAAPVAVPLKWIPDATLSSLRLPPKANGTVNLAMEMGRAIAEELLGLSIATSPHDADASTDGSLSGGVSDYDDVCRALESYRITQEMKRTANYKGRQQNGTIHERIARCERFCALYESLIREVIGPHLLEELEAIDRDRCRGADDVEEEAGRRTVLYQFPPAVRMYCSHIVLCRDREERDRMERDGELVVTPPPATSLSGEEERARLIESTQAKYISMTSLHSDENYGHQPGELNFWMPFTDIDETSALWAESAPGREDWHPFFPLERGGLWRFPGTQCRHFTKPNISGRTRVSLDFRVSVASCYDREWRMPGDTNRHEMREMRL